MLAREGYAFKTISDAMKTPVMIPSLNFNVPLYAPGHTVEAITGIRHALEEDLAGKKRRPDRHGRRGAGRVPVAPLSCRNGTEWYYYEPGEAQYLTIASGEHRFLDYPTGSGYKYFDECGRGTQGATHSPDTSNRSRKATFADAFPGKSIAVGNKSMFMHMVTGADVSVECFARNLYNQGTMAVIHREEKTG